MNLLHFIVDILLKIWNLQNTNVYYLTCRPTLILMGRRKGRKEVCVGKLPNTYLAMNDNLFKLSEGKQLFVIKADEIPSILRETHDNIGHQCARYSYNIAKERYFWPGMLKQIGSYVDNCVRYQNNQPTLKAPSIPLQPLPVITKVWFRVGMDFTGPLIHS